MLSVFFTSLTFDAWRISAFASSINKNNKITRMNICDCTKRKERRKEKKRHNIIILSWMGPFGARMRAPALFCHCFFSGFVNTRWHISSISLFLVLSKWHGSWWSTEVLASVTFLCSLWSRHHPFIHHWNSRSAFFQTIFNFFQFWILLSNTQNWCEFGSIFKKESIEWIFIDGLGHIRNRAHEKKMSIIRRW